MNTKKKAPKTYATIKGLLAAKTKGTLARGTTIEYKPMGMDALRAIKITSSIDLSTIDFMQGAPDVVYYGSNPYSFPDVLNSASWINVEAFLTSSKGTNWSFDAEPFFNLTEGYKGPCLARITERYLG